MKKHEEHKSFVLYVLDQIDRNDYVGDFVKDFARDNSYYCLRGHLDLRPEVCIEAKQALEELYIEWKSIHDDNGIWEGEIPEDGSVVEVTYTITKTIKYELPTPIQLAQENILKGRWMELDPVRSYHDCWQPCHHDPNQFGAHEIISIKQHKARIRSFKIKENVNV